MKPRHKQSMKSLALVLLTAFTVIAATTVYGDSQKNQTNETYEELKLFSDVLEEIENNYVEPVEGKQLIEEAINGMVNSLDPHSNFLPPDAFDNLQQETKGEFGGIGIVITKREGRLTVVSPVEGTPAYEAGIQANDVIVKVGDKTTKDMMLWEAVKLLRGEEGTEVNITVVREDEAEPMEFTLVRETIPLNSVRYVNLKPGYGYLWVTNFRENSTDEVTKALADLEKQNNPMKGLILDLRDNPGGLLNQAVSVSDIFLEEGKIVSIRGRDKKEEDVYRAEDGADHDYPIVVLVNGGTASAAEIVAGALQDNGRALVIGTTSFGKGSVQTVQPLRNGYALKYTIARYYTPSGTSIQAEGIHPDLVVRRRLLDETKSGMEASRIKEEDLQNHLAGPEEGEEAGTDPGTPAPAEEKKQQQQDKNGATDKKDMEKLMRLRDALYEHNDKDPDVLLLDSQINRAYEILKGYEIFQGLQKN